MLSLYNCMSMARPNFSQREMWRHDIQHDDTQHNDNQHNWLICDTRHKQRKQHKYPMLNSIMQSVIMLSVITPSVVMLNAVKLTVAAPEMWLEWIFKLQKSDSGTAHNRIKLCDKSVTPCAEISYCVPSTKWFCTSLIFVGKGWSLPNNREHQKCSTRALW